ncbi:MAG: CBS domain-containing protein [Limnobacter sp.]|nr:CBS domain-containing protein [Limnobacter sp.]
MSDYGPGELVALRSALTGHADGAWIALEAVRALRIPAAGLRELLAANAAFAAAVFAELARRLSGGPGPGRTRRDLASLMMSQVRDAYLRKPFFVDGSTDLLSLCRTMADEGVTDALVREAGRVGIFTTTDLRDALLRSQPPGELTVGELARYEPISVAADAELLEALLLMLRHRVHRVLVREGDEVVGVLSQLELMSFVSNHSHLIALQVQQAASVGELGEAAHQIDRLIELLHEDGVRVEIIAGLVRELNRQVFTRLWTLLAPQSLRDNSCLVVMGSEGRGEQIVKTDQDNALLLRDGFDIDRALLDGLTAQFSAALGEFGYPPCPGGIMLSRPLWSQSVAGFRASIRDWVHGVDPEGPMNLAIFLDASAVAGDASLLAQARDHVDRILVDSDAFYARFASAAIQFGDQGGWWTRLTQLRSRDNSEVDLKKLGIFPIVHGARALALQYRLRVLGTAARLRALVGLGRFDEALARDLVDALHFLIGLKLRNNLVQRRLGRIPDNRLQIASLGTLERDALKDSLAIVRRFRQWLARHYRLDSI